MKFKISVSNSKGYALYLSILPIVWMYHIPGIGMSISTVLIVCGMIYPLLVILSNRIKENYSIILLLFLYFGYSLINSTIVNIIFAIAVFLHLTAITYGAINVDYLRKLIENISLIAALCLIVQVIIYYIFHYHIAMVNTNGLVESLQYYTSAIKTGYSSVEAIYRPSAFFLEPAHFSNYCAIGLASLLFRNNVNWKKTVLVSVSILLTTSGIGFVLTFAIWVWWYITKNEKQQLRKKIMTILVAIVLLIIALALLSQIDYFRTIISRFIGTSDGEYNAITGRTFWWDTYFGNRPILDYLWGFGLEELPDGRFFTGFMTQLYAFGIIGTTLFLCLIFLLIIKCKALARTLIIIYFGELFFANLTTFVNLMFYFGVILSVYYKQNTDSIM